MNEKNIFGKRLKKVLKNKKITQQQLAKDLFISKQAVSHMITGKSKPNDYNLTRIATYTGVYKEYLSGEIDYATFEDWKNSRYILSPEQQQNIRALLYSFGYTIPDNFCELDLIEVTMENKKMIIDKQHIIDLVRFFKTMFDSCLLPYDFLNKNI